MKIPSNKIKDIARFFKDELLPVYDKAEVEQFIVLCFEHFLNIKRHELVLRNNETVSESELLKFNFAVKDLKNNKPIQYILGSTEFYGLKFKVNPAVLIPRPETEELVDLIIKEQKKSTTQSPKIIDIGTGSGCIAIALKKHIPTASVFALDIDEQAIDTAKNNALSNDTSITFIHQDILESTFDENAKFDIIVSNPPYVRNSEKQHMQKNVLDNEPHKALFVTDENPLVFYIAIADFANRHLNSEGKLYLEINEYLATETKGMFHEKGFENVSVVKDINNKNRILCVSKS